MMLAQNLVELGKKGFTNIIVILGLIAVIIFTTIALWIILNGVVLSSPPLESCTSIVGFLIEDACYLNDDEIKISVSRGSDQILVDKIGFEFLPSFGLWEISGNKCLDVKLENRKYGSYCDILEQGETLNYIFDVKDLELQDRARVIISGGGIECSIGEDEIGPVC